MTSEMFYSLGHVPPEYQTSTIIWTLSDDPPGQYGSSSQSPEVQKKEWKRLITSHDWELLKRTFYHIQNPQKPSYVQFQPFFKPDIKSHNVEFVNL